MPATFNLKSILSDMRTEVQAISKVEGDAFDLRIEHLVNIGGLFNQIVVHEHESNAEMGVSAVYAKHEKVLKPIMPKTIMVNEAHVLYLLGDRKRNAVVRKYRKVGTGKANLKSDGTVKLQTRLLSQAAVASEDDRWADNGNVKAKGGRAKSKAVRIAEDEKKVASIVDEWGEGFDLRYFTDEEMTSLKSAIRAEEERRTLGGKVLVAS